MRSVSQSSGESDRCRGLNRCFGFGPPLESQPTLPSVWLSPFCSISGEIGVRITGCN